MFLDTQPPGGKAPMRLAEAIPTCSGSVAWVDDTTLFYATQDAELHRSDKVTSGKWKRGEVWRCVFNFSTRSWDAKK